MQRLRSYASQSGAVFVSAAVRGPAWPRAALKTQAASYSLTAAHTAAARDGLAARTWLRAAWECTAPVRRTLAIFPTNLTLSVAPQIWSRALASPALMNATALHAGLPSLALHASALTRGTMTYVSRAAARQPSMPTLQQIDARLRRCMEAALQSYPSGSMPTRLVLINALQITGRQLPYLFGLCVADTFNRTFSHCLQPVAPPSATSALDSSAAALRDDHTWLDRVRSAAAEIRQSVVTAFHVLRLWFLFTPLVMSAPLVFYFDVSRAAWMEMLRETLEAAGPAFIKWGQWAATRQDMFPPDVCKQLALLQSDAPRHRWAFTKQSIEQSFGMPIEALCAWIDEEPLASGSIGQVHRAALTQRGADVCGVETGKVVVLKVKHPRVSESIQRDFGIMMWVASQLEWLPALRKLRLSESLQQFAAPLREQVDLSLEANNLWRFNKNFARDPDVSLPTPLYPWVSQDILMQSFEEGMHISDYMELDSDVARRGAVAEVGSHCMLNMMLVHNLIHSDLHPGNILVRWQLPKGPLVRVAAAVMRAWTLQPPEKIFEKWLKPHIVLLDVGMATELTNKDRYNMLQLFKSFVELDGATMARHALAFAGRNQRCRDHDAFTAAIGQRMEALKTVDSWEESEYPNSAAAFASILDVVREYEVTLPGHICAVLITVLVLEGWSSELSPERSVLEEVKNVVATDTRSWRERMSQLVDQWIDWGPVLPALDAT